MRVLKKPTELLPTRSSLLSRLRDLGDKESWQDFFNTYWALIYGTARKAGLTDAEAQDVVQETVITVAKHIQDFKYDPSKSFKAWLLKTTRWRIQDQFRKRLPLYPHDTTGEATRTSTVERIPSCSEEDLNLIWEEEWQSHLQSVALERVRSKANPKHYQVFDLYVMKEWPVEKVCGTLHVSEDLVYQTKTRILKQLRQEVHHLEAVGL
jgi:RNA polymerase sigma factor (sigma-70 family)